ncbi:MAG: class I tRNA ligase family protein, partial [Clostridia bacterium]|nr:class I tRNA ligase family protein [Clostridia bacterium]
HGWLLFGGDKMSKSKGNVVDPYFLVGRYGLDAIRYYLLREVPFGNDGVFTVKALLNRYNDDLCNSLGNLVSRTIAMIEKNFEGKVPCAPTSFDGIDKELKDLAESTLDKVRESVDAFNIPDALSNIMALVYRANKYIDETTPWVLAKDPDQRQRLGEVLYNLAETLRFVAVLISPFLPDTAQSIFDKLSLGQIPDDFDSLKNFGELKQDTIVTKGQNLFERIKVEDELKKLDELFAE